MISLIRYREFGVPDGKSIKDQFQKEPYEGQEKIVKYLKAGKPYLAAAGCSFDVFTGDLIAAKKELLSDGEYSWNTALPYYVEKYNMELPLEFIRKVLG